MVLDAYINDDLREEYRGHFGNRCEIWGHLPESDQEKCKQIKTHECSKIDIHHIFHNIAKIDEWSNIIAVNHRVHLAWGHSFWLNELTVVSVYAKWWKSKQRPTRINPYPEDEFNLDEMSYCLGYSVKSWLQSHAYSNERLGQDYKDMCLELMESY